MSQFTATVQWLELTSKGVRLGYTVGGVSTIKVPACGYESPAPAAEDPFYPSCVGSTWSSPGVGRFKVVSLSE